MSASIRITICMVWLSLAALGFAVVLRYQTTPGSVAAVAENWPARSIIKKDPTRFNLVLFAHPQCPCTRATIEELNRLLATSSDKAKVQVWFYSPAGASEFWNHSDLWKSVSSIPGLILGVDVEGREAARFGAETSGTAFLYDKEGRLAFKGGITASRGHAGENTGAASVAALIDGNVSTSSATPVFGCSLLTCELKSPR